MFMGAILFINNSYSQEIHQDSVIPIIKKSIDYEKILKKDVYITGRITDSESLLPIVNSTITIEELGVNASSDSNGLYKIDLTGMPESIDTLTVVYKIIDYKDVTQVLDRNKLVNMFTIVDVAMKNTQPQIVKTKEETGKKEPLHEQVLSKVKTIFKKWN